MAEQFPSEKNQWSTIVQSIYSPKLKGLLYKQLDRDEVNAVRSAVYAVKLFMAEQFL